MKRNLCSQLLDMPLYSCKLRHSAKCIFFHRHEFYEFGTLGSEKVKEENVLYVNLQLNVVNAAKFKRKFRLIGIKLKGHKMCLLYALFKKLLKFYNYLISISAL